MIEITEQGAIQKVIPELMQMVLEKAFVKFENELLFFFLDEMQVRLKVMYMHILNDGEMILAGLISKSKCADCSEHFALRY